MCYLSQGLAVGTTELTASFWDRLAFPSNFLLEHLTDWAYDERLIGSVTIHSQHKLKLNIRCLQVPNGNIRITNLNETFHSSLPRWMNSITGEWKLFCTLQIKSALYRAPHSKYKEWVVLSQGYYVYKPSHLSCECNLSWSLVYANALRGCHSEFSFWRICATIYIYITFLICRRVEVLINSKRGVNHLRTAHFL